MELQSNTVAGFKTFNVWLVAIENLIIKVKASCYVVMHYNVAIIS